MRAKHYKTKLPPYPVTLHVFFAPDIIEAREQQDKLFGTEDEPVPESFSAFCCWNNSDVGLFFSDDMIHEEIAHETLHATVWTMDFIGCKLKGRNDEHYAYLAGAIAKFVYQCAKRAGIKII